MKHRLSLKGIGEWRMEIEPGIKEWQRASAGVGGRRRASAGVGGCRRATAGVGGCQWASAGIKWRQRASKGVNGHQKASAGFGGRPRASAGVGRHQRASFHPLSNRGRGTYFHCLRHPSLSHSIFSFPSVESGLWTHLSIIRWHLNWRCMTA